MGRTKVGYRGQPSLCEDSRQNKIIRRSAKKSRLRLYHGSRQAESKKMKAAILKEYSKPLVISDIPEPRPGPKEVLVKVKACGICGTDVKTCAGKKTDIKLPLVMGHEIAGEVAEVGTDVTGIRVGDSGVVHFYITCGKCVFCQSNRETICERPLGRFGFNVDGGLAEYVAAPARNFIPIPSSLPFTNAAIICDAIATNYRGLSKADIQAGEYVLVMGLGGLGIHGVQIARALGANVIGVDVDPVKLELARQLGFRRLVRFSQNGGFVEEVIKAADGNRISAILETVSIPATVDADLKLLGRGGKLILAGYTNAPLSVPPYALVLSELSVHGTRAASRNDVRAVITMLEKKEIVSVVTKTYPLEEVNCALEDLRLGRCVGRQVVVIG
jgi:propanol-preferring alcohol dehydrogenase